MTHHREVQGIRQHGSLLRKRGDPLDALTALQLALKLGGGRAQGDPARRQGGGDPGTGEPPLQVSDERQIRTRMHLRAQDGVGEDVPADGPPAPLGG